MCLLPLYMNQEKREMGESKEQRSESSELSRTGGGGLDGATVDIGDNLILFVRSRPIQDLQEFRY